MSKKNLREGWKKNFQTDAVTNFGSQKDDPDFEAGHKHWGAIFDKNYEEDRFGRAHDMAMKIIMGRVKKMRETKKQTAKLKEDITQALGDGSAIAGCNKDDVPGPKSVMGRRPHRRRG